MRYARNVLRSVGAKMNARVVVDSPVIAPRTPASRPPRLPETPVLNVRGSSGMRIVALAEPSNCVDRSGNAAVGAIMAAISSEASAAAGASPELALERVFAAANHAARERNRTHAGADPLRRLFFGLAVACTDGERLVIGVAAPGQALVIQDQMLFAFPAIPGCGNATSSSWSAAPLGMFARCAPAIFETRASDDDVLLLSGHGLTQSLDPDAIVDLLNGPGATMEARLADVLASSHAPGQAFIARVGDLSSGAQPTPAPAAQPVEDVARWTEQPAPVLLSSRRAVLDDDLPAVRLDRWHTKVIEASERWLARKTPESMPLDPQRRAGVAMGASSVNRYQPRHALPPEVRSRLPRASHVPFVTIAAVLALTMALGGLAFGYNARQTRATRQSSLLAAVETEFSAATATKDSASGLKHALLAESALQSAERNGAPETVVRQWRAELSNLRDGFEGVHRFSRMAPAAALPSGVNGAAAQLVEVGGSLFVIAGAVYQVDATGARLAALLTPGAAVGNRTAGQLIDGAADGADLVASDGKTLFRWNAAAGWSAETLPATAGAGWTSPLHGAYMGNYYLLDAAKAQILKFSQGKIGSDPVSWLASGSQASVRDAAAMALDGSIHVLLKNGSIQTFFKGAAQATTMASFEPGVATEVALAGGPDLAALYVLERGNEATRLIRINPKTGERTQFQAPSEGQPGYSADAVNAFSRATAFAVNERAGTAAFLSGGQLWIASFSN